MNNSKCVLSKIFIQKNKMNIMSLKVLNDMNFVLNDMFGIDKSNLSDQLLLYRNTSRNFISYGLHLMVVIPCRFSLKLFTKVPSDFTAL